MRPGLLRKKNTESLLEVTELRGMVRPRGLHILNEALHPDKARFVERLKNIECGEQKGA